MFILETSSVRVFNFRNLFFAFFKAKHLFAVETMALFRRYVEFFRRHEEPRAVTLAPFTLVATNAITYEPTFRSTVAPIETVFSTFQIVPSTMLSVVPTKTTVASTIPWVPSSIQVAPTTAWVVSSIQVVPTPEKSTSRAADQPGQQMPENSTLPTAVKSTFQAPVLTSAVETATAQISSVVLASSAGNPIPVTTTSEQFSAAGLPPTVTETVFTTNSNGVVSSYFSLRTVTTKSSRATTSATALPREGLISGNDSGSAGLSSKAKIAIGAAIPLAFIIALAALFIIWRRRRKNKRVRSDEGTGVPELDSGAVLPGYGAPIKYEPVKTDVHEVAWVPNKKEEYIAPPPNRASEMEAAMAITALRAQQLAKNRSRASMTGGPPTFEMPDSDARSPIGSELAADQNPNTTFHNRVYEAVGSDPEQGHRNEMPYSPVYEADAYGAAVPTNQNQNEMPSSPVNRRSELMAGDSMPDFSSRASSPIKRKELNTGPLVVPPEFRE